MSRSFQETSLSAAGLFITDSGLMAAAKFLNVDKLFFRCVINFCFFDQLTPDLCTDVSFFSHSLKSMVKPTREVAMISDNLLHFLCVFV